VRRICSACRGPETASVADLEALGIDVDPATPLWRGKGCDECRGTGYRGRSGIYEMFMISDEVRSLVLRRAPSPEIRRWAMEHGMTSLRMDGWLKARQGMTTIEEVLRVTQEDA
jgi:type II secretory ATPase GspE/PulE/Tfp pilus assembly ATPase PilB-like protein